MFVVLGASGNTGRVVAETLLSQNKKVRVTHGLNTGIVVWEGGHPHWRGETDIQTVLSALLGK